MKKLTNFKLILVVAITALLFSSCDNFMQGSLIKEEIEKEIKYANAPYVTLSINADVNQGTTVPAATVYKEKYKVSDKETIEFTSRPEYQFLYWSASPSENVKFGDVKSTTTWFEIIEGAGTEIIITPVCAQRPYPTVSPDVTGGNKPKNTPVTINFDYVIENDDEDLKKIDIQIAGESILGHYKEPRYTNDNHTILFDADNDNLLDFTSGTKTVNVIIPGIFCYENSDGTAIQMAKEVTSSFTIDYTTVDSAVISLENGAEEAGKLNRKGNLTFYMGEEVLLIYTMEPQYQFAGWNVSLAEGVTGTVEVKDDVVYLDDAAVLEVVPNGDDFDEDYYASLNKYQIIYKILGGSRNLVIKPTYYKKPVIEKVTPENTEAVEKNSSIVITFSKKMDISDKELEKITITMDGLDVKSYFNDPVMEDNSTSGQTQITYTAKKDKLLNVTGGTKNIVITIPQSFCYKENDTEVTLAADYSYTYTVNEYTVDKVNFKFASQDGGKLSTTEDFTLYLNGISTIQFTPDSTKIIKGWKLYEAGDADKTQISDSIVLPVVSEDKKTLTVIAKTGNSKTVMIEPVYVDKKQAIISISYDKSTGTISTDTISGKYSGDTITLNFKEDTEYQFVEWELITTDTTVKDKFTFDKTQSETTITVGDLDSDNHDGDYKFTLNAKCEKRPKVVSASPLYDTDGVYSDRTIVVMFDKEMDENSVYWTPEEIGDKAKDEYKITKDQNVYYWAYDGENGPVFKNITITKLKDQSVNLLKYYQAPTFDETNKRLMRISTKIIKENKNGTETLVPYAPPAATEVLVTIKNGLHYKADSNEINLSGEYSWVYYTNGKTDSKAPEIQYFNFMSKEETTKENVIDKCGVTTYSLNNSVYTDPTTIPSYNITDGKIWIYSKIFDGGSGPGKMTAEVTKVDNDYYPDSEGKTIPFFLQPSVIGSSGEISECIDISELSEGLYKIRLRVWDKNEHEAENNNYYYFVYDVLPPAMPENFENQITEVRKSADKTYLSWTNPDIKDLAKCKVTTEDITDGLSDSEKETTKECDITFSQIKETLTDKEVPNLTTQHKYRHTVKFYDYAGHESNSLVLAVDNTAPDMSTVDGTIKENRTSKTAATFNYTKPKDKDFAFSRIVCKKVVNNEETQISDVNETTNSHTYSDGYEDQNHYKYYVTSYDFSGNASETLSYMDLTPPTSTVDKTNISNTRTSATEETIEWTYPSGIERLEIERWYNGAKEETTVQTDSTTSNKFTSLTNQRKYEYRFYSVDYSGNRSIVYTSYQDDTGPDSLVTKSNISNSRTSADKETISWSANPTGSDVDHIEIDRYYSSADKATFKQTSSSTKTNTFTGLTNQRKYEYRFYSVDYSGNRSSKYTLYKDDTAPAKPTINYSAGRNGRVIISYNTPNTSDFDHVKVFYGSSSGYSEKLSESTSKNSTVTHEFKNGINGVTYKYYLRAYDFSGNSSGDLEVEEKAGAMPGMICYAPGNSSSNLFCSKNYWDGKNPIGVVCEGSDQSNVYIWGLGEAVGKYWGDQNFKMCADTDLTDYYNTLSGAGGSGNTKVNYASGLTWYNHIMSKGIDWSKGESGYMWKDSIWNWVRNANNSDSACTWFIPGIKEIKYILDNYNSMTSAYSTLGETLIVTCEPYWLASPRYNNSNAYVAEFKTRHNDKCDWTYYTNSSSGLERMYMTSTERDGSYYKKWETAVDGHSMRAHAMAIINMN